MAADVFARRAGAGPAVVLLHGLFGAGANLGMLARSLQHAFTVVSLDLPGHGRSRWLPALDLPIMAASVVHWMDAAGVARAHLLGHSLGGKVAMQLALQQPQRVASLLVADIAPVAYSAQHDAVFDALAAVAARSCTSREEAAECLARYLQDDGVIQFLLASLQRDAHGIYRWRFDLTGLQAAYAALSAAPQAGLPYEGPVLFIKGGTSDYIRKRDWPAVQALFPQASIRIMPGCGHWLHVENPRVFNGIVLRFLAAQEASKLDSP